MQAGIMRKQSVQRTLSIFLVLYLFILAIKLMGSGFKSLGAEPDGCDDCAGDDRLDADLDGVPDACDVCPAGPDAVDADGDGAPDACDVCPAGDDALDADVPLAWIYGVAYRTIGNRRRSAARSLRLVDKLTGQRRRRTPTPEEEVTGALANDELRQRLDAALADLNPVDAEIVRLDSPGAPGCTIGGGSWADAVNGTSAAATTSAAARGRSEDV